MLLYFTTTRALGDLCHVWTVNWYTPQVLTHTPPVCTLLRELETATLYTTSTRRE